jgi:aspartate aminotransferase-like enzyme
MKDISSSLKEVYGAHAAALVPGSGTFAMESVARQFGTNQKCLVLRNGYFSYRWTQILQMGSIASEEIVMKGRPLEDDVSTPAYAPCPLDEVSQAIYQQRPAVVFAPHVETSSGIILPDSYIKGVADAVHAVGGLFVLDCIASGCLWVDMSALGVDVLISAPQKGWSSSPCVGIVMLSKAARARLDDTNNTVFALDLKKWVGVVEAYEKGGHMYHTTMPTDSIIRFRDVLLETKAYGFERARHEQIQLGEAVRRLLAQAGFKSVAAPGFGASGVVVSYTSDPEMKSGAKFAALGLQIAAGVPLMLDDFTTSSPDFITFRLGLFGIDKLSNMKEAIGRLEKALVAMAPPASAPNSRL